VRTAVTNHRDARLAADPRPIPQSGAGNRLDEVGRLVRPAAAFAATPAEPRTGQARVSSPEPNVSTMARTCRCSAALSLP